MKINGRLRLIGSCLYWCAVVAALGIARPALAVRHTVLLAAIPTNQGYETQVISISPGKCELRDTRPSNKAGGAELRIFPCLLLPDSVQGLATYTGGPLHLILHLPDGDQRLVLMAQGRDVAVQVPVQTSDLQVTAAFHTMPADIDPVDAQLSHGDKGPPAHLTVNGFDCTYSIQGRGETRCVLYGWGDDSLDISIGGAFLQVKDAYRLFHATLTPEGWALAAAQPGPSASPPSGGVAADDRTAAGAAAVAGPGVAKPPVSVGDVVLHSMISGMDGYETQDFVFGAGKCELRTTVPTKQASGQELRVFPCQLLPDSVKPAMSIHGVLHLSLRLPEGERKVELVGYDRNISAKTMFQTPSLRFVGSFYTMSADIPAVDVQLDYNDGNIALPAHLTLNGLDCSYSVLGHGSTRCALSRWESDSLDVVIGGAYLHVQGPGAVVHLTQTPKGWTFVPPLFGATASLPSSGGAAGNGQQPRPSAPPPSSGADFAAQLSQAPKSGSPSYMYGPDALPEVGVDFPKAGAAFAESDITVTGTYSGPPDMGIMVNDEPAALSHGRFVANHVDLKPGANTVTVTATTLKGLKQERTVTVTSTGSSALLMNAMPASLDNPTLEMEFDYQFMLQTPVKTLKISYLGNGQGDFVTSDPHVIDTASVMSHSGGHFPLRYTYAAPGIYNVKLTAIDSAGTAYEREELVVVPDANETDKILQSVWQSFTAALAAGDSQAAMSLLSYTGQRTLGPALGGLIKDGKQIVSSFSPLMRSSISLNTAEYLVARPSPDGKKHAFFVGFIRYPDGTWHIDSL